MSVYVDKRITFINPIFLEKLKLIALACEIEQAKVIDVTDGVAGTIKILCYKHKINSKYYVESYPLLPLPNDDDFIELEDPVKLLN